MSNIQTEQLLQMETTCGSLLCELKIIWDEVGETDKDRDKMLLELEQECLEIYRRKVDQANRCRAQLRQAIADSEAELAAICSAMGERPVHIRQSDQSAGSLKEELSKIIPQLEEMQKRKVERKNQFLEVVEQIQIISSEINGSTSCISSKVVVDETDLSLRRLEELHRQLHALQTEKSDRLKQIQVHLGTLNSLCLVLGMDFKQTISEIHPNLDNSEGCKDISLDLIERLATTIKKFLDVKIQRMQRLQDLATTMLELWNLMDTPIEEQQMFQNITCNIAASEHEITEPDTLSVDFINYVEAEVSRLEELKSSKMKELVLKKRTELEEICRKTHMVIEADSAIEYAIEAIESGVVDPSCVLDQIEVQVAKVKEEAFSRKDILERVDKWLFACDEECWLEEYNRDENRYNAGRGAHLTLKRAEKARALVNKLPAMVDALASKTIAWEKERGTEFTYDGVRLLSMLEEYTILRDEKEQECRRQRDQKKLQGQLMAEQEALYGSKPSPSKTQSVKKGPRMSTGGASDRRLSMQAPKADSIHSTRVPATPLSRPSSRKSDRGHQIEHDDGLTALATGRRNLSRNSSFGSNYEPESPMMRKPFAPISLPAENGTFATPMKSTNVPEEDCTKTPKVMSFVPTTPQTVSVPMQTAVTPAPPSHQPIPYAANVAKEVASEEIEYTKTPKVMSFVPTTPQTVSVPMQTAVTPAPPSHQPIPYATNVAKEVSPEEIEYSFEEIRAGFMLPSAHRICSTLW